MPAKKKSCFQITSVTQAQVAAIGAADDTESLEDPDESRADDVSSEIYDMSRTEYEPANDRSPHEEAQDIVMEVEAPAHIPQASQLSNKVSNQSGQLQTGHSAGPLVAPQQQASAVFLNSSQTSQSSSAPPAASGSTVSFTSRFRVIKLDHGTGEPFRRGRWTCTEFYDKDSEASVGKSGDSIRHASTTQDPTGERDSGLGHTVGSAADTTVSSARIISVETLPTPSVPHTGYSVRQQGLSGTQSAFSNSKPTAVQPLQSNTAAIQPPTSQVVLSVGHNGLPQSAVLLHKSPGVPPSFPAQQQLPIGNVLTDAAHHNRTTTSTWCNTIQRTECACQYTPFKTAVVQGNPAAGLGLMEITSGRKSDGLLVPGKDPVKPLMTDALQLSTHTVNSLFGNHIPVYGDEDRNPSKAFYQAFQSGSRLRDSKALSDRPPCCSERSEQVSYGPLLPRRSARLWPQPPQPPRSASGTNVVAIDNKIEQAMDLVKSHLMYAVREEVEVLKEQIKELFERNSVLERENAVLKSLANTDQLSQLPTQTSSTPPQPSPFTPNPPVQTPLDPSQQLQPNVTSA
uniref:Uncharacterized protein n=1 Tax=Knipowitschia caucasica TaxID=637954 RepID=A0AAV2JW25_KNICA